MAQAGDWNHNVHYQPVILGAVPPGCGPALDVGCGDGMLAGRLAERCAEVTGIDRDPRMITLARARAVGQSRVSFIEADFLDYPLEAGSFDFVCANTSLHHMDLAAALTAMIRLLRPGGRLAVIGLAADKSIADRLAGAAGVPGCPVLPGHLPQGRIGSAHQGPGHELARGPRRRRRAAARRPLPPPPAVALLAALAQTRI